MLVKATRQRAMTNRNASLRAAQRTTRELGKLFARLGTAQHPRGAVLVAYRNARRAMRDVLRRNSVLAQFEAREVMGALKWRVHDIAVTALGDARYLGRKQAAAEVAVWELSGTGLATSNGEAALDAWVGIVEQQERVILATMATGDPAAILGSDTTIGILQPAPVTREGNKWLASAAALTMFGILSGAFRRSGHAWDKQAIANIDARTTDCCLGVHGQIVPVDGEFYTPDSPAYADQQAWHPFHDHCRTSVVFLPRDAPEDDLTRTLLGETQHEHALRRNATERIITLREELVGHGAIPDGRRRSGDSAAIIDLRAKLTRLKRGRGR